MFLHFSVRRLFHSTSLITLKGHFNLLDSPMRWTFIFSIWLYFSLLSAYCFCDTLSVSILYSTDTCISTHFEIIPPFLWSSCCSVCSHSMFTSVLCTIVRLLVFFRNSHVVVFLFSTYDFEDPSSICRHYCVVVILFCMSNINFILWSTKRMYILFARWLA